MTSINGFLKGKVLYNLSMLLLLAVLLFGTVLQINIYGDHSAGHICEDPSCDGSGQWGYDYETGNMDMWIQCDICNPNARPSVSAKTWCESVVARAIVEVGLSSLQHGQPDDLYIGPGMVWAGGNDKINGRISISITEGWTGQWGLNLGKIGFNIGERRKINKIKHKDELYDDDWFPSSVSDAYSKGRLTGPGGEAFDDCYTRWTWDENGLFPALCGY